MKKIGKKPALFVLVLIMALWFSGAALAQRALPNWFKHSCGQARVTAYRKAEGEDELIMDGLLQFKYPFDFRLSYHTAQSTIIITGHKDFVEIQIDGKAKYGYDEYWLFNYFEDYFFGLADFSRLPLEFSGSTTLIRYHVDRYFDREDPQTVIWFDQKTGLPLLVRLDKRTLVSVADYRCDSDDLAEIDLHLFFQDQPAKITFSCSGGSCAPSELQIRATTGDIHIQFFDWQFSLDFPESQGVDLKELWVLNERFFEEFEKEEWEEALLTCRQMLSLAPQYWMVYLFQAFVYESLDNFLGVVENYQQVLMQDPDNSLALNNLAYHYFLREVQMEQAVEMAERAVQIDRKGIYLDTLGYGYYLVGRYEEARRLLEEALSSAPEEASQEIMEHLDLVLKALNKGE